ncbi:MAG: hypothetical protein Fur0015_13170 [Ignavibacteriales bacterium]
MKKLFVVTGKVKSGKTTRLSEWCERQESVSGILQPVIDGKRFIKSISTGEIRKLEISENDLSDKIIRVGNYCFDKNIIEWAKITLLADKSLNSEWLIVDEFGKLEMDEKGLEPVITFLINDKDLREQTKLIIVVRNFLWQDFLSRYSLKDEDYEIFSFD